MKKIILSFTFFFACLFSIQAQSLYGLTGGGGTDGGGTLIKFIPGTNNLSVAKSFESSARYPQSGLIKASDGKLYGMTYYGGSSGYGVIFSYDPFSSSYTKLKNFNGTDGAHPSGNLVQASNGKLYGMTADGGSSGYGVIFSFDPFSSTYTKLIDFIGVNGTSPYGGLVQVSDGKLYGMTSGGGSNSYGVIFSYNPSTSTYIKLKDFGGANGARPNGNLMQANDGKLYGMTTIGGKYMYYNNYNNGHGHGYYRSYQSDNDGYGVIFSFNPKTSAYKKLVDFDLTNGANPNGNLVQASNGKLYGLTTNGGSSGSGVIFSFDPSSSTYTKLKNLDGTDGANPRGSLMQASNGKLYGTTSGGGSSGAGVIFSYDPDTPAYIKLADFDNTNGASPNGIFMQASNGMLYGTASSGGYSNSGVIFSYDHNTPGYKKLVDIGYTNATSPSGSLAQSINGKLYGMTSAGGSSNNGVIFSYDPSTSTYTNLKDLDGANGNNFYGRSSLIEATDGKLYGTTRQGGISGYGVIFSFDPSTSTYTKLIDFVGINGSDPDGSLVQANDGKLYGTTLQGGSSGNGVIFSFDPITSTYTYTNLNDSGYINGARPYGGLVQANDGKLYGTTLLGGSINRGVIFSFDPSTSTYTKLRDFGYYDSPLTGSLMQASNGKLYGMMSGGSSYGGAIISFDPSSSIYTRLKDFGYYVDINGNNPVGGLMQASDGNLYGMTSRGGSDDYGVIFSFDPSTSTYTKLKDFNRTNGAYPAGSFIELNGALTKTSVNFSGKNNGNSNRLTWKTENDKTLNNYELQRSTDGKNFRVISQVKPKGNINYSYDDHISTAATTIYYYRLKSVNKDGKISYSSIVKIYKNKHDAIKLTVAPNPVFNSTFISFIIQQPQHASLKIFDANGKMIKILADKKFEEGQYTFQWNTVEVSAGIYFLHFVAGAFSDTKKLSVIK